MKRTYTKIITLFVLFLLASPFHIFAANPLSLPQAVPVPTVTLRTASGASIAFVTQNGETVGDVPPQTLELPHLVLFRNGVLTHSDERTLIVEVAGVEVPPTGAMVTLEIETQHVDPGQGGDYSRRITVWRDSRRIANTTGFTQTGTTVVFRHEFTGATASEGETTLTPTDYFRYKVGLIDANGSRSNPSHAFDQDHAFLMENQWIASLPEVQEASDGAAPDELVVYYCDMFPFQRNDEDPSTRLPRKDVTAYVGTQLLPLMVEAFRTQTDEWGFAWHDAWNSYRLGEDAERLSVALSDGQTWFHSQAPTRGHGGISIRVAGGANARYATLTDGIMGIFHHELFHNLQRNINQMNGGDGDVDGAENAWGFFSEGTAELASTVGQPLVQFTQTTKARAYMFHANAYMGGDGFLGELNTSYERMRPYYAGVYWRFLYEQCGGMQDTAAGMAVIRRALTALYSEKVVDIDSSTDLVGELPRIMDQALEGSSCPFQTYEDSLTAFARAVYGLRLEGGRCVEPGIPTGCGFYDPNGLYRDPPVSTMAYTGRATAYAEADQPFPAGVRSSFGVDFVEVTLDPTAHGRSLTVEFYGAPGAEAQFNVQLWKLNDSEGDTRPQRVPAQTIVPETLTRVNANGHLSYVIPVVNTTAYNRLGLIITRLDAKESSDPVGEYTINLYPDAERDGDDVP